jgi:hypothetical protein
MATLPSDPEIFGAVIVFHDITSNTILIGEEGSFLFNDKDKKSPYYTYNLAALVHPLKETVDVIDKTGNKTSVPLTPEQLTDAIIPSIMDFISKHPPKIAITPGLNLLFPIVAKNKDQPVPPIPNVSNYFSQPRIQTRQTESCPKGGIKQGETALECILREIYEEIGNIFIGPNSIKIQDKDWIRDSSGKRYTTGGTNPYAVFYKKVTSAQASFITKTIQDRRTRFIGEMFDFMFKAVPPIVDGRRGGLSTYSFYAIARLNQYFRIAGQPQFAGGDTKKRTIRRKYRRHTQSKRKH